VGVAQSFLDFDFRTEPGQSFQHTDGPAPSAATASRPTTTNPETQTKTKPKTKKKKHRRKHTASTAMSLPQPLPMIIPGSREAPGYAGTRMRVPSEGTLSTKTF